MASLRPFMPLYIADYLRDTTHLGALESGAYLHLIMDYWQNGKLPDDDRLLARIARLTDKEWKKMKPVLQAFFHDGWKHSRIDREIARASDISEKRRKAVAEREQRRQQTANNGGSNDPSNTPSNDPSNIPSSDPSNIPSFDDTLHTSHFTKKEKKDAADADASHPVVEPEAELFRRGREILGRQSGGLVSKLLKAKNGSTALARAAIEQASTKADPREYIGRVLHPEQPSLLRPGWGDEWG